MPSFDSNGFTSEGARDDKWGLVITFPSVPADSWGFLWLLLLLLLVLLLWAAEEAGDSVGEPKGSPMGVALAPMRKGSFPADVGLWLWFALNRLLSKRKPRSSSGDVLLLLARLAFGLRLCFPLSCLDNEAEVAFDVGGLSNNSFDEPPNPPPLAMILSSGR